MKNLSITKRELSTIISALHLLHVNKNELEEANEYLQDEYSNEQLSVNEIDNLCNKLKEEENQDPCESCVKLGTTICGNDHEEHSCYEKD